MATPPQPSFLRLSSRHARQATLLGLAIACTSPRLARAQSETETQEAEARFTEGLREHDLGNEEASRLKFVEAYSVLKRPNLLLNLARAEHLTGHFVEAITHYKAFVANSASDAADRETARKRIVELNALVGHILIDAPRGADVSIDGQPLPGKTPFAEPADVSAGPHTVQAQLGSQAKMTGVSCVAGQTVTAKIEIDVGAVPLPSVVAPTSGPGGLEPEESRAPVRHVASGGKIATTVVLGVAAVAAVGVGVGMQLDATSKSNALNADDAAIEGLNGNPASFCANQSQHSPCPDKATQANALKTDENVRTGAFIGAGALALAGMLAWVVWPNDKAVAATRFVPMISPQVAGLEWVGAF